MGISLQLFVGNCTQCNTTSGHCTFEAVIDAKILHILEKNTPLVLFKYICMHI